MALLDGPIVPAGWVRRGSAGSALLVREESFDADPHWIRSGLGTHNPPNITQSAGYNDTDDCMGGTWRKARLPAWLGETLGAPFTLESAFHFDCNIRLGSSHDGGGVFLGLFNSGLIQYGSWWPGSFLGLLISGDDPTPEISNVRPVLGTYKFRATGTTWDPEDIHLEDDDTFYALSFDYNPATGAESQGQITVVLNGSDPQTYDLEEFYRDEGLTATHLGFVTVGNGQGAGITVEIDDLSINSDTVRTFGSDPIGTTWAGQRYDETYEDILEDGVSSVDFDEDHVDLLFWQSPTPAIYAKPVGYLSLQRDTMAFELSSIELPWLTIDGSALMGFFDSAFSITDSFSPRRFIGCEFGGDSPDGFLISVCFIDDAQATFHAANLESLLWPGREPVPIVFGYTPSTRTLLLSVGGEETTYMLTVDQFAEDHVYDMCGVMTRWHPSGGQGAQLRFSGTFEFTNSLPRKI